MTKLSALFCSEKRRNTKKIVRIYT